MAKSKVVDNQFLNKFIPYVGIKFDASPLYHFVRDILVTLCLCLIGYQGFQAAFATMLSAGFMEIGNGIAFQLDGKRSYFDFLDFLPSVVAGFLVTSLFAKRFEISLLLNLFLIYLLVVTVLLVLNLLLKREIIFKK